jgi:hypothetical protein
MSSRRTADMSPPSTRPKVSRPIRYTRLPAKALATAVIMNASEASASGPRPKTRSGLGTVK